MSETGETAMFYSVFLMWFVWPSLCFLGQAVGIRSRIWFNCMFLLSCNSHAMKPIILKLYNSQLGRYSLVPSA